MSMSKYLNMTLFLGSLMFSLSWMPGFEADAGSISLSSSAAEYEGQCDFDKQVAASGESSCRARLREKTDVSGTVTVRRVPRAARLSDGANAKADSEELEVTMEASAPVAGCETCKRNSSVTRTYPISDARSVTEKALREFGEHAAKIRGEAAELEAKEKARIAIEVAKKKRVDACQIDEAGTLLEGKDKHQCLMNKIAALEPEKAAKFYDENMKEMLMEMVRSENGAIRMQGLQLLRQLNVIEARNPYLKESLIDMTNFAKYSGDMIQAQRMLAQAKPEQRAALQQRMSQILANGKEYFEKRGLFLNENVAQNLSGWSYQGTWGDDMTSFKSQLEQIYSNHRQAVSGTSATSSNGLAGKPLIPSVPGTRTGLGTPSTATPYIPGAPATGAARTGTTAAPARPTAPGVRVGPSYGQKVR